MEEPKVLRVRARGTSCVQDFERMELGRTHSFIGRARIEASPGVWGWKPTDEVVELPNVPPYAAEYIKAIRDKALWAADEATARHAGVVFDPTFGDTPTTPEPTTPSTPDEHTDHTSTQES